MADTPVAAPRARRGLGWAQVAVSAATLAAVVWWATKQDAPSLPTTLRALLDLASAVVVYAAASLLRAERWHRILARNAIAVGRADAYRLTAVGYMGNNILPARAGDILRVVLLGPLARSPRRAVLGTVVAERLLDALALALIFGAAAFVALRDRGVTTGHVGLVASIAGAAALVAAVGAVALGRLGILARARRFLAPVAAPTRNLLGAHGASLLALSLTLWILEAGVYLLVGRAVGLDLGLVGALYLVALTNLSALVPAAPGYVGTFDAAVVLGLRSLGHPGGAAVGYLLLLRFVLFAPITIVGLWFFLARYSGRDRLRAGLALRRSDGAA